jgi:hypothetical protein
MAIDLKVFLIIGIKGLEVWWSVAIPVVAFSREGVKIRKVFC